MIGFYVLAVAVSAALLAVGWFAIVEGHAAGLKLGFLAIGGGLTILWSLRPRRDVFEAPGSELTRADQPEIFAVVESVAQATGQAMPDVVYASGDFNAAVANRGGFFGFGGRRVMIIGLPLVHSVSVDQLRAILAHEFGHYGGGDTQIGRMVYRSRVSLARTLAALKGRAYEVIFAWYGGMLMKVTSAVARQQELAADQFAARATSTASMVSGLEVTDWQGLAFSLYMGSNVQPMIASARRPPICAGFVEYVKRPSVRPHVELLSKFFGQFRSDFDAHPPIAERVAALNVNPQPVSGTPDSRPASTLLRQVDVLESRAFRQSNGDNLSLLKTANWSEFLPVVRQPFWRDQIKQNLSVLAIADIAALPETRADRIALGRQLTDPQAKLADEDDLDSRIHVALHSALCVRLLELGWTPCEEPADRVVFTRDGFTADPFAMLNRTDNMDSGWRAFCAKAGLSGKLVSEETAKLQTRTLDHVVKAFREA